MRKYKKIYVDQGIHPDDAYALAILDLETFNSDEEFQIVTEEPGDEYVQAVVLNDQKRVTELYCWWIHSLAKGPLNAIPYVVSNMKCLKKLILPNHTIYYLPYWISKLDRLEFLDLSDNMIETIPVEIGECTSLKELHLKGNRISELPEELFNLTNLEVLDLMFNKINEIPEGIKTLKKLKKPIL